MTKRSFWDILLFPVILLGACSPPSDSEEIEFHDPSDGLASYSVILSATRSRDPSCWRDTNEYVASIEGVLKSYDVPIIKEATSTLPDRKIIEYATRAGGELTPDGECRGSITIGVGTIVRVQDEPFRGIIAFHSAVRITDGPLDDFILETGKRFATQFAEKYQRDVLAAKSATP